MCERNRNRQQERERRQQEARLRVVVAGAADREHEQSGGVREQRPRWPQKDEQNEKDDRREQDRRHLVELERSRLEQHPVDERVQRRPAAVEVKMPTLVLHVEPAVPAVEDVADPGEVTEQPERREQRGGPRTPAVAAADHSRDDDHADEHA